MCTMAARTSPKQPCVLLGSQMGLGQAFAEVNRVENWDSIFFFFFFPQAVPPVKDKGLNEAADVQWVSRELCCVSHRQPLSPHSSVPTRAGTPRLWLSPRQERVIQMMNF